MVGLMKVIKQRNWTNQELLRAGFAQYDRIKEVVMARRLPESEAPLIINTEWGEQLVAETGYAICYRAGDTIQPTLQDYYHWPVEPYIFDDTYRPWDQREWTPTSTEKHLTKLGCRPYYKLASIWAREITQPILMQSPEHQRPVKVNPGRYLVIGIQGEPYTMGKDEFFSRYQLEPDKPKSVISKLLKFFGR
jgi:hypothetical protein